MRFWGKLKKQDIIFKETVVSCGSLAVAVKEICDFFDLSKPVALKKHSAEMKEFGRTLFYPSDFIEPVSFDSFEIEYLKERKNKA